MFLTAYQDFNRFRSFSARTVYRSFVQGFVMGLIAGFLQLFRSQKLEFQVSTWGLNGVGSPDSQVRACECFMHRYESNMRDPLSFPPILILTVFSGIGLPG